MAAVQKTAISYITFHIPVGLYTATQDTDIHFNQLCKEDGSRVKYKKVCAHCGKEVKQEDIVKGFEYAKDQYVIVTDAEFEKAKTKKDKIITIEYFTKLRTIPPEYFDKAYHLTTELAGNKAYELLRKVMYNKKVVAIAKTVIGQSEKLLALIPTKNEILMQTLFYSDEIKEIPKEINHPEIGEKEMELAELLIDASIKNFEPTEFRDEYQERLKEIIAAKIDGKEIMQAPSREEPSNVLSLMDQLTGSLQQLQDAKKPAKKPRGRKATSA